MPKKFKGENSKAAAARERKQAAKQEADERRKRAEEDAYWKDDDKHAQRKQDRKVQKINANLLCRSVWALVYTALAVSTNSLMLYIFFHRLNVKRSDKSNLTRSKRPNFS